MGISVLQKEMKAGRAKFENTDVTWGIDLDSEHERYLTEKVYKGPVVLINYPKDIKAFYETECRREDGRGHGHPGPAHRRNYWRLPARGLVGSARGAREVGRIEPRGHQVVRRAAAVRLRAARGLWTGLRAVGDALLGRREHPRRDPLPADAGELSLLEVKCWSY